MAKLKIRIETSPDHFDDGSEILFNPNKVTLEKSVCWRSAVIANSEKPSVAFTHGAPQTLSLDLFFDTYEKDGDVREPMDQVMQLTQIAPALNHRPPRCKLAWGSTFGDVAWSLTRVSQVFTLFHPDGRPARGTLSCSFRESPSQEEAGKQQAGLSAAEKTHVVARGETLSGIAAEAYGDPTGWRAIAEANNLADPRRLTPGTTLTIPPRPSGGH